MANPGKGARALAKIQMPAGKGHVKIYVSAKGAAAAKRKKVARNNPRGMLPVVRASAKQVGALVRGEINAAQFKANSKVLVKDWAAKVAGQNPDVKPKQIEVAMAPWIDSVALDVKAFKNRQISGERLEVELNDSFRRISRQLGELISIEKGARIHRELKARGKL